MDSEVFLCLGWEAGSHCVLRGSCKCSSFGRIALRLGAAAGGSSPAGRGATSGAGARAVVRDGSCAMAWAVPDVAVEDGSRGVCLGWKAAWTQVQSEVMSMLDCEDHLDSGSTCRCKSNNYC